MGIRAQTTKPALSVGEAAALPITPDAPDAGIAIFVFHELGRGKDAFRSYREG